MNRSDIPAPGFVKVSGKRRPPAEWGDEVYCQIRSGIVDEAGPWKVRDVRWIHEGHPGDVVAVKAVHKTKPQDGRQANGSYE